MPTFKEISKKFTLEKLEQSFINAVKEVSDDFIEQIQKRLKNSGVLSDGSKLHTDKGNPYYSDYTQKKKKEAGQPTSRVTLFYSGDFYETFYVVPIKEGFEINADFRKSKGKNVFDNFKKQYTYKKFTDLVTGLTEQEQVIFFDSIINEIVENFKKIK